jgi:antitoxin VapB
MVYVDGRYVFPGSYAIRGIDNVTGDVVLSNRPGARTWNEFFALLHSAEVPADFMEERPLNVALPDYGVFDDEAASG